MELSHVDRMRNISSKDLSFAPKSFWEYKRGSYLDTLINDERSFDNQISVNFLKEGRGTFLSKFNSEYSKRIIEMWSTENDLIVDPFSGRSSRALTSVLLKRNYVGFDVIETNLNEAKNQYDSLIHNFELGTIKLINDSSENILEYVEQNSADLILTCPPYFNIEKYDSVKNQLTDIKGYDDFIDIYKSILTNTNKTLKEGKFFCVVLANFRIDGKFYDFRGDTATILKDAGLEYFDEIILEMSPAKREPLYNQAIVKLNCLKTHEYLLVFRKPASKVLLQKINDEINNNRPNIKATQGVDSLFWKNKECWINKSLKKSQEKSTFDEWA